VLVAILVALHQVDLTGWVKCRCRFVELTISASWRRMRENAERSRPDRVPSGFLVQLVSEMAETHTLERLCNRLQSVALERVRIGGGASQCADRHVWSQWKQKHLRPFLTSIEALLRCGSILQRYVDARPYRLTRATSSWHVPFFSSAAPPKDRSRPPASALHLPAAPAFQRPAFAFMHRSLHIPGSAPRVACHCTLLMRVIERAPPQAARRQRAVAIDSHGFMTTLMQPSFLSRNFL
jgi:hypothetical protein